MQNWVNLNYLCSICLQKNEIPIKHWCNGIAPLLAAPQNVSVGKASLPGFCLPRCWRMPVCPSFCGWDSGVISLGLFSLLHIVVLYRCRDFKAVLSNLHQYSEKTDSLTESLQRNAFLLVWSTHRLKQNRVVDYTTPFYVNLDLFSHSEGGDSGCIQNASRNSAGAAASQPRDRGNQVLPAGAVELPGLDCFLSHQQDALGPAPRRGSGSWPAASDLAAASISHTLCPWERKGFHLPGILNTEYNRLKWPPLFKPSKT